MRNFENKNVDFLERKWSSCDLTLIYRVNYSVPSLSLSPQSLSFKSTVTQKFIELLLV